MKRFSQLILFSGILAVGIFKWAHPTIVPQNRTPFLPADMDKAREWEREQKVVMHEAQQAHEVFTRFGCGWEDLSVLTARYSRKKKLPARLVAAQIVVESSCRPDVVSPAGAVGLLQINKKVWPQYKNLTDPENNLEAGTEILAGYVQKYGIKEGLHHYNGMSDPTDTYSSKILEIARR